jgi:hypothetical protein
MFREIGSRVVLPYLEDLTLDGLRCAGADLSLFLNNNNRLKQLDLRNLDITGSKSFDRVPLSPSCPEWISNVLPDARGNRD